MLCSGTESRTHTQAATSRGWMLFLFVVLPAVLASGCSGFTTKSEPHVTVAEIVQMSEAGAPDTRVVDKIRRSGTVYRLTASQFATLKNQGVSDKVINYMQQTYLEAVRRNQQLNDQRYWTPYDDGYDYGGYPFGWDGGWYPDEPYDQPGQSEDRPSEE